MRREFPAAGVARIAPHPSLNEPRDGGLYVLLAFLGGRARNTERGGQTDQLISAAQQSAVYRAVDKHDQISALCRVTGSLLPRRRRRCCCFISR